MKISELARTADTTTATIKYYIREGLLPAGRITTSPNQAEYGDGHVERLRLIRALADPGGLSLAAIREVLDALEDTDRSVYDLLGTAHAALPFAFRPDDDAEDAVEARADIERYVAGLDWRVPPDAPSRAALAEALVGLRRLGLPVGPEIFDNYAEIAFELGRRDVWSLPEGASRPDLVRFMAIGTVLFETALTALRRMAQSHHTWLRYEDGEDHHLPGGRNPFG